MIIIYDKGKKSRRAWGSVCTPIELDETNLVTKEVVNGEIDVRGSF